MTNKPTWEIKENGIYEAKCEVKLVKPTWVDELCLKTAWNSYQDREAMILFIERLLAEQKQELTEQITNYFKNMLESLDQKK